MYRSWVCWSAWKYCYGGEVEAEGRPKATARAVRHSECARTRRLALYTETKQRSCKPACLQYKKRVSTPRMAPASLPPDPAEPSAPIFCCLRDLPLPLQSTVASSLRPLPLVRSSGLARWCVPFSAYATGELQLEPEALRPEGEHWNRVTRSTPPVCLACWVVCHSSQSYPLARPHRKLVLCCISTCWKSRGERFTFFRVPPYW